MGSGDREARDLTRSLRGRLVAALSTLGARPEEPIARQIALGNLARIRVIAYFVMLVHLASLAQFAMMQPTDAVEATWRARILAGHAVMLPIGIGMLILISRRSWRAAGAPTVSTRTIERLVTFLMAALLVGGSYLTWADQAVTDNITPFVLVCIIVGLLLLAAPVRSVPTFLFGAVVFVVLLATGSDGAGVGISNQVNGLSTAGLGLTIGLVRFNGEVRSLRQQAAIDAQREELQHTAAHDELTGLLNRRQANLIIARELHRQQRDGTTAMLLLLDLDHFKRVNDEHGHPVGDALLVEVAALLRSRLRRTDVAARWGGEEFLILLVDTDPATGCAVAEELRSCLSETQFDLLGRAVSATASIGVAMLDASVEDPLEAAYHEVDEAMYEAKRAGRNRVVVAQSAVVAHAAPGEGEPEPLQA